MAVIPRDEAEQVLDKLISEGFTATFSETKGGILRQSQYTLFIAVKKEDVEKVYEMIRDNCTKNADVEIDIEEEPSLNTISSPAKIGGAIVFIWDIDKIITCN